MKRSWLFMLLCPLSWASLQTQVGQFAASTGGATTTVSASFQGKAIIFFSHDKTTNPESALAAFGIGAYDGTHAEFAGWAGTDAVATTNAGQGENSTRAYQVYASVSAGSPTAGVGGSIASVAFNSNNFVVTFNATPASAWLIDYILIGGTDVTNVFTGETAMPTSTGTLNVTNVGFKGTFALLFSTHMASGTQATHSLFSWGAAVSSTKRWSFGQAVQHNQAVSANVNGMTIFRNDAALVGQTQANAVDIVADFVQFTATGFDLSFTTAPASAWILHYIVIQGGQWDVGSFAKNTAASTDTVSGEAFQPTFLGLCTSSPTANNTNVSNAVGSCGATDGTNAIGGAAFHNDAVNTVAKSIGDATHMLIDYDRVNNPLLSFTSFNADGWTGTWSATGSAHEVGWFTAANNAASPLHNLMLLGVGQ